MELDAKVCYCFHVSRRKLVNFARLYQPKVASQLSQCGGAGTGCGWCIPFLKKIAEAPELFDLTEIKSDDYGAQRKRYIETQKPRNQF